jgi:ferrous-iron efflux pump FieF
VTEASASTTPAAILPSEQAARIMKLATYASVAVACVLIVAKFAAWLITDSVSLLSTLIDSLVDAFASVINLFAVRQALQPADREHRFGHGKAEPLAGLGQAAFISGSAMFLVIAASQRLFQPQPIVNSEIGYWVMGFAIILTLALVVFQKSVIKRTGSHAISADSLHYQSDLLINFSIILSLLLSAEFGIIVADALFALAIAAYILWSASQIARSALQMLMDRELPDADRQRIREIAMRHPGVKDVHDMRTRTSGLNVFIQLHLEMDRDLSLLRAHGISDAVMLDVENNFTNAEVLIHVDPEGVAERREVFS